ncbi:DNA starvation/stationary phase protection protein [Actinospica durhamensis]|uniref:DNA starvation/stationary phase protection protein n=1 Tax=Actinospica durhamensis TaxID=1508375 RepID=A0A941EW49_9ACTN|nr:DNA starvation/stationary phase protection protein [Actinospica durhamensis]MBR7835024.1 DNA starvation/stationary phase protection protein [Actinospica durhamensis]
MTTRQPAPAELLQARLHALNDMQLTLKHAHWNVLGPEFVAVHEMLDAHADSVRAMTDEVAERIATLGTVARGTPGALVAERTWEDYRVERADALTHLRALDAVYTRVVDGTRAATAAVGGIDPVTEDLLIGQLRELERLRWFIRAHTAGEHHARPA